MPFVYLVRCKIKENRTIWTLIHPKFKEYKFFFVDRSVSSNNDELLNLARKHIGKNDSLIVINTFKTEQEAGEAINKILEKYQQAMKQSFLVIMQAESTQELKAYGVHML